MTRKALYLLSLTYLAVPVIIFFSGWLILTAAVPLALMAAAIPLIGTRRVGGRASCGSCSTRWMLMALAVLVAVFAGIGGWVWQVRWDHSFRNSAFEALVNSPWPVTRGAEWLCYYFGFWLPSALGAKLTHSMEAGFAFQTLWGAIGLWLTFLLATDWLGKFSWKSICILLLFSGPDIIGALIMTGEIPENLTYELWNPYFWWTSHFNNLINIYNSTIPGMVGTLLVLGFIKNKIRASGVAVLALLCISSPFPAIGLLPFVIGKLIADTKAIGNWRHKFRIWFSVENITGIIVAIPIAIFLSSNQSVSLSITPWGPLLWQLGVNVLLGAILEIGFFIPFIWSNINHRGYFISALTFCIVIAIFRPGGSIVLSSRCSIPLILYISLEVCRMVGDWKTKSLIVKSSFILLFSICSLTPLMAAESILIITYKLPKEEYRSYDFHPNHDISAEPSCRSFFIAPITECPIFRSAEHGDHAPEGGDESISLGDSIVYGE